MQELPDIFPEEEDWDDEWYEEEDDELDESSEARQKYSTDLLLSLPMPWTLYERSYLPLETS